MCQEIKGECEFSPQKRSSKRRRLNLHRHRVRFQRKVSSNSIKNKRPYRKHGGTTKYPLAKRTHKRQSSCRHVHPHRRRHPTPSNSTNTWNQFTDWHILYGPPVLPLRPIYFFRILPLLFMSATTRHDTIICVQICRWRRHWKTGKIDNIHLLSSVPASVTMPLTFP